MHDDVTAWRAIIIGNVPAAWAIVLLTLAMKLIVPVGFMPQLADGGIRLIVCNGMEPPVSMAAMPSMATHHHDHGGPQKPDAPCPFAGLSAPTLGGADPVQLAIAIATIIAAGLVVRAAAPFPRLDYLRPPLRGPPTRI